MGYISPERYAAVHGYGHGSHLYHLLNISPESGFAVAALLHSYYHIYTSVNTEKNYRGRLRLPLLHHSSYFFPAAAPLRIGAR